LRRKAILNSLAIQGKKGKLYLTAQCGINLALASYNAGAGKPENIGPAL
jgi:hypothetical protein